MPNTAKLVAVDDATKGTWASLYGSGGYAHIGGSSLPAGVTLTSVTTANTMTWQAPGTTTDARAPQYPTNTAQRFASTWYTGSVLHEFMTFRWNFASTTRVAFLCLDWDNTGRQQTVEVLDGVSNTVFDTRSMGGTSMPNGRWLVYDCTGDVKFKVNNNVAGKTAVVALWLFGGAPTGGGGTPPPSADRVSFKDGKVVFDKYRRTTFCPKCDCSDRRGDPAPCSFPEGTIQPSCVVARQVNFTACPECTVTATTGDLPFVLYHVGGTTFETNDATDTFRLPGNGATIRLFASITHDPVECRWFLTVKCKQGGAFYTVWQGEKTTGYTPTGTYVRTDGCDETYLITVN